MIMKIKQLSIVIFTLFLFSCEGGFDKSLISNTEKLISPNGEYTLCSYHVASPMAFGSGLSVINIFKSDEKFDFTDRDILRFGKALPFWIKWKDNKTLTVKCLMAGDGLQKHQPYKTDVIAWKEWIFEVEYYSMYSSGATGYFSFEDYSIDKNKIKFKSKSDSLVFNKDEVQFSLDSNHIYVKEFKTVGFNNKLGLSFSHYDLTAKGSFNQKFIQGEQPFVRIKP
ncbi:hypothetical protein DBR43_04865 [Pedobacter sp. KBW06]|nr:hypothetical protein DBR43_04865 [Pedobacter sp. KBW06]